MSARNEHPETAKRPLPDGWKWVRLGEVCQQDRNIVEPRSVLAQTLPYLSLEHVESGTGRILKKDNEVASDEGVSATFAFDCRHVLYGKLRPYLNKVALPDFAGRCTTEMIPLLATHGTDREFLGWVLRRPETVSAAMRGQTGSRMPRADMDELMNLEIPLPPLAEQRRIAAVLREQMAAVARARRATEEQLEAANALPAALLRQVFPRPGEPLPDGWKWVRLGEVVTAYNGHWGSDTEIAQSKRVLVLGVGNISNDGFIRLEGAQERYLSDNELEAIAETDDLLVVKSSGSATNIRSGKTGLCPPELSGRIACSNFMIKLVVRRDLAVPFLVWQFLNSDHAKKFVRLIAGSTTYPNIKWNNFKEMPIPLPPLAEQRRIAAVLREQMAAVERARNVIEEQLEAINKLPAAILRKAFNGEL